MINLIPSWAQHYDEFWKTIRKRNLWIIKLRFGAAFMLAALIYSAEFILGFQLTGEQVTALIIITFSIVIYNLFFIYLRGFVKFSSDSFNPLHLSLIQISTDLIALYLLCYFTGTIESPLFMLFVFHIIIGSLILPGKIVYSTAAVTIIIFSGLTFLEYYGIIPHHGIEGLLVIPLYKNFAFISSYLTIFSFVIIMTVVITNRIANELYKMEQQLIDSLNKLRSAEIEKQKYIMGVVHEIKTPITALQSYLDIILGKFLGPLDEKVEEKLERSRIRSGEAISLIDDILRISKIKLLDELSLEDIDIKDLVCSITEKQNVNLHKKVIELKINDNRINKKPVKGDKFLLEIAFSNIVSNAVKYTGFNGKIEIDFQDDKNSVEVNVSDSGVGIPEEDQKKIFNDFYRASNIKHKDYNGTGLGLSIVKQIITRHNGEVKIESPSKFQTHSNPGTTVTVILPY